MSRTRIVAVLSCLSLLIACGGGGGGGGDTSLSEASFSGNYALAQLFGSQSTGAGASAFGTVTADGAGNYDPTLGSNSNGTYTAASPGASGTYTVDASGNFTFGPGTVGGLASDSRLALYMLATPASPPSLAILLRKLGTYSNATMTGNYHMAVLAVTLTGPSPFRQSAWTSPTVGLAISDGAGSFQLPTPIEFNDDGVVSETVGNAATYSIAADGTVTMNPFFELMTGAVTNEGSFCVLGGVDADGSFPMIFVAVKESAGASNATFSGEYWTIGVEMDPSDSLNWSSFFGTATADGAGNLNLSGLTSNAEGTITTSPGGGDVYAVSPNGTITSGGMVGGISADGDYGYFSGDSQNGEAPKLYIFIRK